MENEWQRKVRIHFPKVNRKVVILSTEDYVVSPSKSSSEDSFVTVDSQLHDSLERKLSSITGPTVSLAVEDEQLIEAFASDFEFINDYKLHPGIEEVDESFNGGCACNGICDPSRCSCLSQEGDPDDLIAPYGKAKEAPDLFVLTPDFLERSSMIYECTPYCGCDGGCWNRVVQHGRTVCLGIFHTGIEALVSFAEIHDESRNRLTCVTCPGLRSPDCVRAGQFIDCYLGEVITAEKAELRENSLGGRTYDCLVVTFQP